METLTLQRDVALAPLTTLEVGGRARALARCADPAALRHALGIAHDESLPVALLGGGSNVLISDRGYDGMIVQYTGDHLNADLSTGRVHVGAGYAWDRLVEWTLQHDLTGLECLSGIPGWVGAAPIQNIGAYGQEVGDRIDRVHVLRLDDGHELSFDRPSCGFSYRESRFKGEWRGRYCVTALDLALERGAPPAIAYEELATRLAAISRQPTARQVREVVLEIRRGKSMVLRPDDPNRRSAGSFFTNPIVDRGAIDAIRAQLDPGTRLPHWELDPGRVKVAAAWLIERAGFSRGHVRGPAGLSSAHVLALVNRGGARASDLLELAREVRDAVQSRFGIRLVPEPVPLGFDPGEIGDLWPDDDY